MCGRMPEGQVHGTAGPGESHFDRDRTVWSRETRKDYTNLPEGAFTFRVEARNLYGALSRHRDASGSSRLHRVHHRQAQRATPGRDRSCEGRAGLGHVTRRVGWTGRQW